MVYNTEVHVLSTYNVLKLILQTRSGSNKLEKKNIKYRVIIGTPFSLLNSYKYI